jgi:hypothetical protein
MTRWKAIAVATVCAGLGGCAGLDVAPVGHANGLTDANARGYRYYEQAPFLFVRSDGKGGLTSEIIYLPDTNRLVSAQPYAYFATIDATLTFNNGTLTEAKVVGDQTAVPAAFVDALGKVAVAAIGANAPGATTAPRPYLFKITFNDTTFTLTQANVKDANGNAVEIHVTIVPGAAK